MFGLPCSQRKNETAAREERGEYVSRGVHRVPLVVHRYPRELGVPALTPLGSADLSATSILRVRIVPPIDALREIRTERASIEAELGSIRSEGDPRVATLRQEADAVSGLEEAVVSRSTRLWNAVVGFVVSGRTSREGERGARTLEKDLAWLGFRMWDARYRVAPLLSAIGPATPFSTSMGHPHTDDGIASLLPLWEDRLEEPGGVLLGLHAAEGTPLLWDRFGHQSHSSAVFGQTGSGKTHASAVGWLRLRYRHPDLNLFVLDPIGGLTQVVRAMGGAVHRAGTDEVSINPLDPATTGGDVRLKTSTVNTLLRALIPSVTDEELAMVDTALSGLYEGSFPEHPPIMEDLYEALEQESRTPKRLLLLLRPLLDGSFHHLNYPTEMNLSDRLLGFDLSGITPSEMPFYLILLLDFIHGEMRRREGPKLLVIDEAHYLARTPGVSSYLDYLVRHARHYHGGLELLSQNPEDFLGSEESRSVILNLDSVLLLRLRDGGERVASLLGLSEDEVAWLKKTALPATSGFSEGIFRTGTQHLPVALVSTPEEHELLMAAFRAEREVTQSKNLPNSRIPR